MKDLARFSGKTPEKPESPASTQSAPASPQVQLLTISEEEAGQRIDNFLLRVCKGVPKAIFTVSCVPAKYVSTRAVSTRLIVCKTGTSCACRPSVLPKRHLLPLLLAQSSRYCWKIIIC